MWVQVPPSVLAIYAVLQRSGNACRSVIEVDPLPGREPGDCRRKRGSGRCDDADFAGEVVKLVSGMAGKRHTRRGDPSELDPVRGNAGDVLTLVVEQNDHVPGRGRPGRRGLDAENRGGVTSLLRTHFSGRQASFPWFSRPPTSVARVPISKLFALSASSVPRFLRLPSDVALAETPHFRPFPARQASPTLGPNSSQDVPGGLTPCRFGTQQPWLAPQNSLACSSYLISQPNVITRSVVLTSTMRHPPPKSPSGFIFMSVPFERSSAKSPVERGGTDQADATRAVAGGSLGASGVPLTTSDQTLRDRARQGSACKHVSGQLSVI